MFTRTELTTFPLTPDHKMAVITSLQKTTDKKGQETIGKKHSKSHFKSRPITATLDHPLILDIKLLKKLDMTTFTKKGLIALSKFCGVSLINKTDAKKKLNKCVKSIQYSKKQLGSEGSERPVALVADSNKNYKAKRKIGRQVAKAKPRIRFRIKEDTSPDEDSLDVVCKKHNKVLKPCTQIAAEKSLSRKSVIDSILGGTKENIVPEPCKTCSRFDHPERFHSHPKVRLSLEGETAKKSLEDRFRNAVTTREEKEEMKKAQCAKNLEGRPIQESCEELTKNNSGSGKLGTKSHSSSSAELSSPETGKNFKNARKPHTPSSTASEVQKKTTSKLETNQKGDNKPTAKILKIPGEEDLKYVTGCYICGKQVSPKLRIKHEKSCIAEWRTQNSLISPDKRKPEPKRPDYRFTSSGDVDYEGTLESIWANHMDSLVPCKKCGRKFFPDRIERHENCCNNAPINVKYKH